MKKIAGLILVSSLLVQVGCSDKTAERYAAELNAVLRSYRDQVQNKILAEKQSYKNLASIYARAHTEDVIETLWLERLERARTLADKLIERSKDGETPSASEIQAALQDYASFDFAQTRTIFERESAAQSQYLADLENLDVDTANIQTLMQSLDELAKPKGRTQQLKDFAAFSQKVDSEYQKLGCADLAKQKKCLEAQKASEESKTPKDQTKLDGLSSQIQILSGQITERDKAGKCPDLSKIECPESKAAK